jgi:hypothetical protein
MANVGRIRVLDTIRGSSYLAIKDAMKAVERRKSDLAQYKIAVVSERDSVAVIFLDKDTQSAAPKNFGVRRGSEHEMNPSELAGLTSDGKFKVLDAISGSNFLAIKAAMAVFQRHNPDLAYYIIEVVSEGDSVVVIFADKDRHLGTRGSLGPRPGFEVEMDANDLRVLRSNFVK